MTDPENLLARWSRRKSDARAAEGEVGAEHNKDVGASDSGASPPSEVSPPAAVDLPPLESITAETNLRAFLDQGVPAELAVAALRRGWSTDPAIRDFIGLSENSWDFNAPGGISGFGSLAPADIEQLLAQALDGTGMTGDAAAATPPSDDTVPQIADHDATPDASHDVSTNDLNPSTGQNAEMHDAGSAQGTSTQGADVVEVQPVQDQDIHRPSRRRRHGGALPDVTS